MVIFRGPLWTGKRLLFRLLVRRNVSLTATSAPGRTGTGTRAIILVVSPGLKWAGDAARHQAGVSLSRSFRELSFFRNRRFACADDMSERVKVQGKVPGAGPLLPRICTQGPPRPAAPALKLPSGELGHGIEGRNFSRSRTFALQFAPGREPEERDIAAQGSPASASARGKKFNLNAPRPRNPKKLEKSGLGMDGRPFQKWLRAPDAGQEHPTAGDGLGVWVDAVNFIMGLRVAAPAAAKGPHLWQRTASRPCIPNGPGWARHR